MNNKSKTVLAVLMSGLFLTAVIKAQNNCVNCIAGQHEGVVDLQNQNNHAHRIANGNPFSNQPTYSANNVCGLNYYTISVLTETRTKQYNFNANGSGFPLVIPFTGCFSAASVLKAFAYFNAEYTEASPPTATITITNPANVANTFACTMIGSGLGTCWPVTGSADYRADVTSAISAGNGSYNLAINGFVNPGYEINGVTIIVIYTGNGNYSGSIDIWDGCEIAIGGPLNFTGQGFTTCAASNPGASAFILASDMQSNVNNNQNDETFNGSKAVFANDFWNCDVIPTSVNAGQTTCVFNGYTNNGNDCWAWVAAGLYWQNTTCVTCVVNSPLQMNLTVTNPTCGQINGTIIANVTGGQPMYTYMWSPNVSTGNMASGLSAGKYVITVVDGSGCDTVKDSVTLTKVTLLVNDNQTNVLCFGQANGSISLSVKGGVPPYTFTWTNNVGNNNVANNLSAGTYYVDVVDNNGCALKDTITITQPNLLKAATISTPESCNGDNNGTATVTALGGTPPYNYLWSNGGTISGIANITAGTYNVTVTDSNGCTATSAVLVAQPAVLTLTITGPPVICTGESGTLVATPAGGTSPYGYGWSDGESSSSIVISPIVNTTYTVTVTDANNCQTSAAITVDLGPPLIVSVPPTQSLCYGMATTVCATATGGTGTTTYTWTPGNLNFPCITVNPSSTTIYTITVSDACGSSTTASVQVSISPLPNVGFTSNFFNGCYPLCVNFQDLTALASGNLTNWAWNFGNGDTSYLENPFYCFPKPGTYSVTLTATSDSGCSSTLSVPNLINVFDHPHANFVASPQPTTIYNPSIQFTDATSDSYGLAAWSWNFGDNNAQSAGTSDTSTRENPSHTFSDTGTYCPLLVVTDNNGCTDTVSHCIVISSDYTMYIPNAFTPGSPNGINSTFAPKGTYIGSYEMYIYDRWGMQIYHTTDINKGWNGSVNNNSNLCQEDTYVYVIKVTDAGGNTHTYMGKVSLL